MPAELYLDTARLGRMHPDAIAAGRDFDRLCGDRGGSALVERLIGGGTSDWPESLRRRYPGLAAWEGLEALKRTLRSLAGVPAAADVHLAGRSAVLMRLAARALFRRCRRVLHTDIEWPAHVATLESERRRAGRETVTLPLRDRIFRAGVDARELAALLANEYRTHGCDGLFLTSVSHDGVRFPLDEFARAMAFVPEPRFVVVDGAQALGHVPAPDFRCDVLLAGGHKWIRAGRPLAMAFAPRPGSLGLIRAIAAELEASGGMDDPIFDWTRQLAGGSSESFGATADPSVLVCNSAAASTPRGPAASDARLSTLLANAASLAEAAAGTGWRPLVTAPAMRSGILLLRPVDRRAGPIPPQRLRSLFQSRGVALTAYQGAVARVSMPVRPWRRGELDRVRSALVGLA